MKWIDRLGTIVVAVVLALVLSPVFALRAQQPVDISVPSGTIVYRDATTATGCWAGWTEYTTARGAYIVGLQNAGTKATLTGTALTNLENRPAGSHTHVITVVDPGHVHSYNGFGGGSGSKDVNGGSVGDHNAQAFNTGSSSGAAITASEVAPAGAVAGTNAPFIQLLVCVKT